MCPRTPFQLRNILKASASRNRKKKCHQKCSSSSVFLAFLAYSVHGALKNITRKQKRKNILNVIGCQKLCNEQIFFNEVPYKESHTSLRALIFTHFLQERNDISRSYSKKHMWRNKQGNSPSKSSFSMFCMAGFLMAMQTKERREIPWITQVFGLGRSICMSLTISQSKQIG